MISVAIPCYRSSKTIGAVVENVRNVLVANKLEYQFVLVNDGSPDNTFEVVERLCKQDPHVVGINLSKNYGQHAARLAAIPFIKGEYVVYMDDDGQHPAGGIMDLYNKILEGFDVVYADFQEKKHSGLKRIASNINTATLSYLTGKPKDVKNSSFSIMRYYILKEMRSYKSPYPSWTGYIMQVTRNIGNVKIEHKDRLAGESGYSIRRMVRLYMNSLTGFSVAPLRIASMIGWVTATIGFISGLYFIIMRLLHPEIVLGFTSIISALFFLSGIIMMILGMVGEYIGRIYMTISGMPQYIIRNSINDEWKRLDEKNI